MQREQRAAAHSDRLCTRRDLPRGDALAQHGRTRRVRRVGRWRKQRYLARDKRHGARRGHSTALLLLYGHQIVQRRVRV
jgi:hypothetical protein